MAANMYRYRAVLSGWDGAPGLTTFYARFPAVPVNADIQGFADLIASLYTSIRGGLIPGLSVSIESDVGIVRDTDGQLQEMASITPPAAVTGQPSGDSRTSRAVMVVAQLHTDLIANGKRVRGRHFHGPTVALICDPQGNVDSAFRATVVSAYNGILDVSGGRLVVWHRPSGPGANDGDSGFVQSVTVTQKPGVLTSRRD